MFVSKSHDISFLHEKVIKYRENNTNKTHPRVNNVNHSLITARREGDAARRHAALIYTTCEIIPILYMYIFLFKYYRLKIEVYYKITILMDR